MNTFLRTVTVGAAAGAASATALNAVTYLDMSLRGRPSSDTPELTIEALSKRAKFRVPGTGEARENRATGLGPLAGLVTGVGSGVVLALARSVGLRPNAATEAGVATLLALLALLALLGSLGR